MASRAIVVLCLMLLAVPAWAAEKEKKAAAPAPAADAAKPGAPASDAANDPVVARIDKVEFHRSEVVNAMRGLPPQMRQQPVEKLYPVVLNNMIAGVLLSEAGRKAKLADNPILKKRLAQVQDQFIAELYVEQLVTKTATDQKLHTMYDKVVKEAPPRDEVSARHILLTTEADAKAVIEELKKGADFAKLADEKTTDPTGKSHGGDLGFFTKDEMVPEFADAAFKLKKGEFSQTPIKTQFGWHVIKVEDRRVAPPPSFDQVKPRLIEQIRQETINDRVKELASSAKIEVFNLDGSKPAAAPPAGAAAPAAPTLAPETAQSPPPPTLAPATKQ